MKRKNATRSALFTSIISLLLCVSMLVGTTFAWFTDEVVSGRNVIAAGNLDVELYYSKTKDFTDEKKVDSQTILFTDKEGNEIKCWEPGVVAYSNLQVANVGTLALTYRMTLNFDIKNYVEYEDGSKYDLSNVLKVAIVEGGFEDDRSAAHALSYGYNLESFSISGELKADQKTKTYGVVIYWEPGSNEYDNLFNMNNGKQTSDKQPLSVELGINLFATQEEYEQDSFDDRYDETADHIIAAGEVVRFVDEDLTGYYLNNGTLYITDGSTLTNDGRGFTTTGDASLSDVVVKAGTAGTYAMVAEGKDATLTLDNVTLNSGGGAIGAVDGATVIINSGSIDVDSTSTSGRYHIYAEGEGSTVIVNGGNFDFNKTQNQKRAYVYAGTGTTVIINGGNFGKASARSGYTAGILGEGEVIIKGGTFKFDPSNWVALGYEVTKEGDTWTVSAIPAVEDTDALAAAINGNQSTIVLGEGTFHMPAAAKGKNLTIIGAGKDTVIEIVPAGQGEANGQLDYNLDASTVAFNNLTIKTNNQTYAGYARLNATYNNCVFENCYCLNGTSTFTGCTFNVSGNQYNLWTWGAPEATFNGCTFNSDGKALLLYGRVNTKLTLNDCTFNDNGGLDAKKAAVEIGNDYNKSYTLTVNNTKVNGYEINNEGFYTGTTLWGNKNSMSCENLSVIVDGVAQIWDANGLANALTSDAKNISVALVNNIDVPMSSLGSQTPGSGEYKLGGDNTESIVIDLNGKKLTLTTTYMTAIGAKNVDATITIKNGSMNGTGNSATTWNINDLIFANCNYVIEDVVFDKEVALENTGKTATLKDVTIKGTGDYYALWISARGQNVEIDGLTITTTGRGIKIDEQYVDAPAEVTLKVSNAKFTTANKAAIMVKSAAGADITLSNVDITGVVKDTTNAVWVDSDAAAYADKVTVSGGTAMVETP